MRPVSESADDKAVLPTFPDKSSQPAGAALQDETVTSTEVVAPEPAATPLPDAGLQQARPVTPALDKTADILNAAGTSSCRYQMFSKLLF